MELAVIVFMLITMSGLAIVLSGIIFFLFLLVKETYLG